MQTSWKRIQKLFQAINHETSATRLSTPIASVGIALSGGMDSVVLLHWARHTLPESIQLRAFHVHHGLQTQADGWVEHCQHLCTTLDIPLAVHRLDPATRAAGQSVEAWARKARYEWFSEQAVDCFLIGHHQDDQAETLLLQLFRGSGIAGIAGMPQAWKESALLWARPFLHLPRSTLLEYAIEHDLTWIEDPSNADTHWQRNWVRHTVMPVIKARQPHVEACLARTAAHCAETWTFLQGMMEEDLTQCSEYIDTLSVKSLKTLHPFRQKQVIRAFMHRWTGSYPSAELLQQALTAFLEPRDPERHRPQIHYAGLHFTWWQDTVWVHLPVPRLQQQQLPCLLEGQGPFPLSGGVLTILSDGQPLPAGLNAVMRKGGECMNVQGSASSDSPYSFKPLKKLWQDAKTSPWDRATFPLVMNAEGCIVWIPLYPHFEPDNGLAQPSAYIGTGSLLLERPDLQLCWVPERPRWLQRP